MSKPAVGRESAVSATPTVDFDRASLERFARREFGEPLAEFLIDRVAGGQSNPTYFVTLGGHRMVLRKKPSGETLPSAHAVDREHRVLSALAGTGVPVPKTILYCEDLSVVGTPFYLMERLEGRSFPRHLPSGRRAGRSRSHDFRHGGYARETARRESVVRWPRRLRPPFGLFPAPDPALDQAVRIGPLARPAGRRNADWMAPQTPAF